MVTAVVYRRRFRAFDATWLAIRVLQMIGLAKSVHNARLSRSRGDAADPPDPATGLEPSSVLRAC